MVEAKFANIQPSGEIDIDILIVYSQIKQNCIFDSSFKCF